MDVLKYILLVAGLGWLMIRGTEQLGYHWHWYRIPKFLFTFEEGTFTPGPLLQGLKVTLILSGISLVLSFLFGLFTALLRLSPSFMGRIVARGYLEIIRNTPLLVQIFLIYFVLGPILGMERFTSAVLALSLFEGAYASEIFRSGIVSIEKGQWEAAYSLGLNTLLSYRKVILPQAVRRILPPLTGQAVSLVKDSALVSTIAIFDLTMRGQAIVAETYLTFEIWFTVAGLYLLITVLLSMTARGMEKRFRIQA